MNEVELAHETRVTVAGLDSDFDYAAVVVAVVEVVAIALAGTHSTCAADNSVCVMILVMIITHVQFASDTVVVTQLFPHALSQATNESLRNTNSAVHDAAVVVAVVVAAVAAAVVVVVSHEHQHQPYQDGHHH